MNLIELKESRAKLIHDARQIIEVADNEKRDVTHEENERSDTLLSEADRLDVKIETEEKRQRIEAAESRLKQREPDERRSRQLSSPYQAPNFEEALRCYLLKQPERRMSGDQIENMARCGLSSQDGVVSLERRDLYKGATPGSNLVAWQEFYNGFYKEVKSYGPVLNYIKYLPTESGNALPIPVADDTANMATILAERAQITPADPTFSNVNFGAYKYESHEVVISAELLQDSQIDLEQFIPEIIAERIGKGQAYHVTVGTGSGQPFGIVTRATPAAIPVVASGTGSTAAAPKLKADDWLALAESLDDSYQTANCAFMAHPSTIAQLRTAKDLNGQYLYLNGLQNGVSSQLYGFPIIRNQYMATSGANARLVVFGDFSKYLWRQAGAVRFRRLTEIRALTDQISFVAFMRGDGNLVQPNAVKYLAAPAS